MAGFDVSVQPTAARGTVPTTQPNYSSLGGFNISSSSSSAAQPLRSNLPPPAASQSSFGMGMGMGMNSPLSATGMTSSSTNSSATNYQPNYFSQPTTTATVFSSISPPLLSFPTSLHPIPHVAFIRHIVIANHFVAKAPRTKTLRRCLRKSLVHRPRKRHLQTLLANRKTNHGPTRPGKIVKRPLGTTLQTHWPTTTTTKGIGRIG